MSRLIMVSNRVAPISEGGPAAGGLAVGIYDGLRESGGMWFGWSGTVLASGAPRLQVSTRGRVSFATIGLSHRDYDQYYRGFSNATLWPTFHYRSDLVSFDRHEYDGYKRVNAWLAHQLKPLLRSDDVVWVHDYHLIPFAEALRREGVANRLGFFLHTSFPSAQVLAIVPPHGDLMRALSCYDLVGFQTELDLRAFADYLVHEAQGSVQAERHPLRVDAFGRRFSAGVYPVRIYPDEIGALARDGVSARPIDTLKASLRGRQLIVGVDRLDYSKGLIERLRAFEKLLERSPEARQRAAFVQIAPPTRADMHTYQHLRRRLEEEAGRINGRFADLDWTPIVYLHRQYERQALAALFRASRVGYVTPLRDGMNLVAKEYVAAQDPQDPGVLVLSCFAGAARELSDALIVNPLDIIATSEALDRALHMALAERQARHAAMLASLRVNTVSVWRDRFVHDLKSAPLDD